MKKTMTKRRFNLSSKLVLSIFICLTACQSNLDDEIETSIENNVEKAGTGANRDIKLDFYLGDNGLGNQQGNVESTGWAANKQNQWSEWGGDSNFYDPDWIVLNLITRTSKNLKNLDFRIAIQLSDGGSSGNNAGLVRYTPWASQGGGWSSWATDSNAYDFDAVRFMIQTRPYAGLTVEDVRFGVQLTDGGTSSSKKGIAKYTPWLSQGGGSTGYAGDSNFYDPDAIRVKLEIIK
ncbi:hypothetical protein ATO12_08845 [Aquimarina atlantica]|uniref:Uncharacterized protein n=1 Tax=Aquimarina atlantica TaxID=1317122 RepID=A0A023BXQ7_9FLAO|nr:hypothetical protein [Aquimarina atlantica]EZH74836.1 hypothetical protein ATO12_08845 [Aquimarina atlantica]